MTLATIQVWSPVGFPAPRLVVAAARAGALGVLDLTLGYDPSLAGRLIRRTAELAKRRPFGIHILERDLPPLTLAGLPEVPMALLVHADADADWPGILREVRRHKAAPIASVSSRAAARAACEAGFEALVIAGNEGAGWVAEESSFILLQAVLADLPASARVWVRGGIGPTAAAGCLAAGAAGVVLDGAVLLTRESPLGRSVRERVARWDGVETSTVTGADGRRFRGFLAPGSNLQQRARDGKNPIDLAREVGWNDGMLWPVGQDAAHAGELARRHVTVGGVVHAVEQAIEDHREAARNARPLAENSPLAQALGTRYPIVQGPMTRVSDRAEFAEAVAAGGGLPFLALALLRGRDVRPVLEETRRRLDGRAWGVGLLGFVDADLRREQIEAIRQVPPPFALIAGGRPDQARDLESLGITTYLHVPSPGLLRQFLRDGARRFVLEGRECGGHVGPRSSFVLWEQAIQVVQEVSSREVDPSEIHLLFAGGIHDARSGSVVSAMAAPLAARGVKLGVLVGTAYLFTREAVASGAIVPGFQQEAMRCDSTVLLETGPGHLVRVSPTPFTERFEHERRRLVTEGKSNDEIRETLETLNVGRLRVAAKGIDRTEGAGSALVEVAPESQFAQGLYMLGQAATLRRSLTTIGELHAEIASGHPQTWSATPEADRACARGRCRKRPRPSNIAIIGMAAVVPGAGDVRRFWTNTLEGRDAITEVSEDRWDWRHYFDADPKAPDRIISRWGGFVPDIPFDPLRYGMPPTSLTSIEPLHLITLEVVRAALDDAGYSERAFPRDHTAVVLGAGGGAAQLAMGYAFRSYLPLLDTVIPGAGTEALARCGEILPEWTEDSFPGILLNVAAGRVANRFDLGGANYTVDAACGSSLAAASLAVRELESGAADMVVLGGADTVQNPFTYLAFSKTQAFSARGRCRPFDSNADGIVISEAVAVVILKRLADAERDGDRIYAVIKGLGASSDGRAKGLTAPRYEGQISALHRAYEKAGVSPATIGYVEAHGTGTAAGDLAEVSALKQVFHEAGAESAACALGSVKSLIGHTKCAAGLAGLINATLALHHRVLPPTIGIDTPNPKAEIEGSPFHLSVKARPWLRARPDAPRRTGVSAFGFGGTNFHAVIEAYEGDDAPPAPVVLDWPVELFVWRQPDRNALADDLAQCLQALESTTPPLPRHLAHTLSQRAQACSHGPALAIVAASIEQLRDRLRKALDTVKSGVESFHEPGGIHFVAVPTLSQEKVAFLFPGQGSQYPDMLGELSVLFPEVLSSFEAFDAALVARGRRPVGRLVYPPTTFRDAERDRQKLALAATDVAQPALGAASLGMLRVMDRVGLRPNALAGHSYGELVALHAAGVFPAESLAELSEARGRFLLAAVGEEPGTMAAVHADHATVEPWLAETPGVVIANANAPHQTVVSGPRESVGRFVAQAKERGARVVPLTVACAFHSPLVAAAREPLVELASRLVENAPTLPVYSNVTTDRYDADPTSIASRLGEHLARPVQFVGMVERMHADGIRVFVEVGANSVLTGLVDAILADRPHLAVACDPPGRKGLAGLLTTLGRLFAEGVPLDLTGLTADRDARILTRDASGFAPVDPQRSPTTWLVNGNRVKPATGPEPRTFGSGPPLPIPKTQTSAFEVSRNGHTNGHAAPSGRHGKRVESVAPAHAPTPATAPASKSLPAGSSEVLAAFQKTMQNFLEVQRATMLGYLGQSTPAASSTSPPPSHHGNGHAAGAAPTAPRSNGYHPNGKAEPRRRETVASPVVTPAPVEEARPEPTLNVEERLLAIVRDRTGYPAEMLRLDLDMEADLGIDSIKRVEILGTLRDALPPGRGGSDSDLMDQLARARTLGAIVERVSRHLVSKPAPEPAKAAEPLQATPAATSEVRRMLVEPVDAPLPDSACVGLARGGVVLITDDERGIAAHAAARLEELGYQPIRINVSSTEAEWHADLTSESSVDRLVNAARSRGAIVGILHLLPLRRAVVPGLDPALWGDRMATEVRGLYLIARACAEDLARASRQGGGSLVAATALGGCFASSGEVPGDFFPGHGAIAGLVKTLAREWDGVGARVVDLNPETDVEVVADRLVEELLARDDANEVGYDGDRRVRLEPLVVPLEGAPHGIEVPPGAPIVLTGGARGITAVVAEDLARLWRPTLLLIGTSPLPSEHDPADVAGVTAPAALRARLLERLGRDNRAVTPAEVERAYQSLRRDREIRATLERLRALGSTVEYAAVDVRDASAMKATLDGWREKFGAPVGMIHGAGVIQDKLLRDKTPESFDRVVSTKLDGALVLARLVDPSALRFVAFFSSIAGRFGNRGQADYAAANDALNKLAIWLDQRWPARVVSMIWGPWAGVGMVSDLETHLASQGLGMIPPADGRERLSQELRFGTKGQVEVIVAADLGNLARPLEVVHQS